MKVKISGMWKKALAVLLSVCIIVSAVPFTFAAENEEINYVSIGDSMTNGYCFEGYEQGNGDKIDFLNGKGVYGVGAYPLQFEGWLEAQGYTVNHTKLAPSAMRAEDLNYLLGGRSEPTDGWQNQVNGYTEIYDDAVLAEFFQKSVADADLITMCVGNASFGAYMLHRVTDALGVFGASLDEDEKVNLNDALYELDEEDKQFILEVYDEMVAKFKSYIPADLYEQFNVGEVTDLIAYTAAGFIVNYKGSLERIVELNPDAEVILVGLMNTTYGMKVTLTDGTSVPVGDIMDGVFGALNAYIAALPTAMQAAGQWQNAKFYYAEQPNPLFISQQFANLKANGWGNIDGGRLSGDIVRERNIAAYNDTLKDLIAAAFSGEGFVLNLPEINLDDVETFEASNPDWTLKDAGYGFVPNGAAPGYDTSADEKNLSIAIYLGIEDAVAASTDTLEIPLEGLITIATDISSVFTNLELDVTEADKTPADARNILGSYLTSTSTLKGMCKIYALFKVGNGMSVHPTPSGHDKIAYSVITAYTENHTANDETIKNLKELGMIAANLIAEYYDDAYAYAYDYAEENGYITAATDAIDGIIADLIAIDLTSSEMTDAFKAEIAGEIEEIIETLLAAKALILEADVLDEATLKALIAALDEAGEAIENLLNVLKQAGADVAELVIAPAVEVALDKLENEIVPSIIAKLEVAVKEGTQWLLAKAQDAYDAFADAVADAAKEYAPEVADWIYDYLYNNPEKVIAFFNEYGDEMVNFLDEYKEEIFAVLGFIAANYGDEILEYIVENDEEILATMVALVDEHGENAWDLIVVYLEELGVIDAIESTINDKLAELAAIIEKYAPEIEGVLDCIADKFVKLEDVLEDIDDLIAELENSLEEKYNAAVEALLNKAKELKAAVEELIAAIESQIESEIAKAIALVESKIAELKAAAEKIASDVKAKVEGIINDINEKFQRTLENFKNDIDELLNALEELIAEAGNEALKALYNEVEKLKKAIDALIDAVADKATEKIAELIKAVKDELDDVLDTAESVLSELTGEAKEMIESLIEEIKADFAAAYEDATTDDYTITDDSYYVALGDSTAVSESYVDALAEELGIEYKNLASDGATAATAGTVIAANAADIMKADLITLGYGNNEMTGFTVDQLINMINEENTELDWAGLVGEENVHYVEKLLAEVDAEIIASGIEGDYMGVNLAELVSLAVESYAYSALTHAAALPQVVDAIVEINPDALIVLVGMYNPLDGVVIDVEGTEIAIGDYLQYLVDAANAEMVAYAILTGNAIYVDAPEVETINTKETMTALQFILEFVANEGASMNPAEEGHEYIKDQIMNALTVKEEQTAGLLGDADGNGVVNSNDAMLVLQYYAKIVDASELNLAVCDVDGNSVINSNDAMLILQYYAKVITVFPVEK